MANWCDNYVRFTGDRETFTAVRELFLQLEKDNEKPSCDLPKFITAENRVIIDISVQPDFIYYRTRWQPNLQALQQIADHFGAGFTNRYCEPATCLWGEARYTNGHGENIRLEPQDLRRCSYNCERACYYYKDKSYQDDEDLFNEMLDDKLQQIRTINQISR